MTDYDYITNHPLLPTDRQDRYAAEGEARKARERAAKAELRTREVEQLLILRAQQPAPAVDWNALDQRIQQHIDQCFRQGWGKALLDETADVLRELQQQNATTGKDIAALEDTVDKLRMALRSQMEALSKDVRAARMSAAMQRGKTLKPPPKPHSWTIDKARYEAVLFFDDGSSAPPLQLRDLFQQFLDDVGRV
jgi:hypothetical protein